MNNISDFPDTQIHDIDRIKQQALDWLIRLDGDERPSAADLIELKEWMARSQVHQRELNSLNRFWSNNILTELVVPLGKTASWYSRYMQAVVSRYREWHWSLQGLAATAAISFLAVSIVVTLSLQSSYSTTNGLYVTAIGQQTTQTLADGSVIYLNTNSQLEVDYGEQYRNIRLLKGEVHFEVAKNPQRPFRVYAGGGRVQAVGTAFTVYLADTDLNVLVTEGSIALANLVVPTDNKSPAAEIDSYVDSAPELLGILNSGQSLTVNSDKLMDAKQVIQTAQAVPLAEMQRRQSWREGLLVFSGESLAEVVQEISRYTTVSIEIEDPALSSIQIGGRFRVGELDELFGALDTNFGIRITQLGYNRVLLSAK